MTQNNEKVTQKCKGTNCGTTNNNHSKECLAEHEAAYKSNEYDTDGNRHPEFRYKGYKGEPLPNNHTIAQFNAYVEGIKARVSPISQNEQQPKQIPDGWKLVLIEPDFNMKQAALEWNRRNTSGAFIKVAMEYHVAEKVYKAMINASPTNTEVGNESGL